MKSKESVLKCPSCSEILPALANVCPSCNYVIAARNEGDTITLQELVYRIENTLAELKALPHPSVMKTIKENIFGFCFYLSVVLGLCAMILDMKGWNDDYWGPVATVAGLLAGIPIIVMGYKFVNTQDIKRKSFERGIKYQEVKSEKQRTFREIEAEFEKSKRLANIFFGEDRKVKLLLSELDSEIAKEKQLVERASKSNRIVYLGMSALLVVPFLLPSDDILIDKNKVAREAEQENLNKEANAKLIENIPLITLSNDSIEVIGNIGASYTILTPTKITFEPSTSEKQIEIDIPIKISLKQTEKETLKKEINDILENCSLITYSSGRQEGRTLKNCAKTDLSLSLLNELGVPNGIKLHCISHEEFLSSIETFSQEIILVFSGRVKENQLELLKDVSGASVNLVVNRED
jgi:hypothetical protein